MDISKAFDKVWHDVLIYKLKCNGARGSIPNGARVNVESVIKFLK